jgi:hypothetical protein
MNPIARIVPQGRTTAVKYFDKGHEVDLGHLCVADGAPVPPIGDLSDIILLSKDIEVSKTIFEPSTPDLPVLRVVPYKRIDPTLVKSWISFCEKNHHACNHTPKGHKIHYEFNLVFIDVDRRCLVKATSTHRYLALSYVWGEVEQLRLSVASIKDLEKENSLDRYWFQVSPVLKDAIEFTREIGERYLWADTVCIVHDSPNRYIDIARMNDIYQGAVCTLVAVDGVSASTRLPGVSAGTREITTLSKNLDLHVGKRRYELASIFAKSKYEHRAWTFQERLLSTRCLYFTREQLYFHCDTALWSEDRHEYFCQRADGFGIYPSLDWKPRNYGIPIAQKFEIYVQLVQQYTRRKLSFETDRLNAFSGIANALANDWEWDMVCGMPAPLLDQALLWVSSKQFPHRIKTSGELGGKYLPSWTWAGWTEGVHYRVASKRSHISCMGQLAMMTGEGIKRVLLNSDGTEVTNKNLSENSTDRAPEDEWRELLSSLSNKLQDPTKPESLPQTPNLLLFTAETLPASQFKLFQTRLSLSPRHVNEDTPDDRIRRILDPMEKACGILIYSGLLPKDLDSPLATSIYQYILISKSADRPIVLMLDDEFTGEDDGVIFNVFDPKYWTPDGRSATFNVMLVKWTDGGYAERIAVGQVHEDAWNAAVPVTRRVILG